MPSNGLDAEIYRRWAELEDAIVGPVMAAAPPPFGVAMRQRHFSQLGSGEVLRLQPTRHYLNQGGTGAVMEPVLKVKDLVARLAEAQPMSYHREIAPALIRRARAAAAEYLGAPPDTLSFTASASAGFYAVLRSMSLAPGDIVVVSSLRYHSFGDDLHRYCELRSVRVCTVQLPLPIRSSEQMVDAFTAVLAELEAAGSIDRVRLALFDHVSSKPAVLFPVTELCALFRACGIPTLIDGAHCPGLLHWAGERGSGSNSTTETGIRLESLGADFYLANFYKWMLTPRACACLYTDPRAPQRFPHIAANQLNTLLPATATTSRVGLETEALYAGVYDESTRDYAPFLALPAALALLRWMGPQALRQYCSELCRWGTAHLSQTWGTSPPVAPALSTAMITVELPIDTDLIRRHRSVVDAHNATRRDPQSAQEEQAWPDSELLSWAKSRVHAELLATHEIEVPIFVHEGALYLRASCWAYNAREDLIALGEAVLAIVRHWHANDGGPGAREAARL